MPVEFGDPPVIWAISPGNESEGRDVEAPVYGTAILLSWARVEFGLAWTKLARSRACIPSTLISRTCWMGWLAPPCCADAGATSVTLGRQSSDASSIDR